MISRENSDHKKLKTFWVVYGMNVITMTYYILSYNLNFKVTEYNNTLFSLFGLLLITPSLYLITKKYSYTALFHALVASANGCYFLFTSGGIKAPGIFWLAAIPVMFAVLLGKKGGALGTALTFTSVVIFYYLPDYTTVPNIIELHGSYHHEKIKNVFLFITFSTTMVFIFSLQTDQHKKALLERNRRIDSLVRILIHDIGTPLTIIQNGVKHLSELNEMSNIPNTHRIKKAIVQIREQIEHIKTMRALHDNKLTIETTPTSINHLVEDVLNHLTGLANEKHLNLSFFNSTQNCYVHLDEFIFKNQILTNLITNAIKFSNPGSKIEVESYKIDNMYVLSVRDQGIGMPKDILQNIFNVNYKTSRRGTKGEKGTGYGMPIVKEFMKIFGGEVAIESTDIKEDADSRGTTVSLYFPLIQENTHEKKAS